MQGGGWSSGEDSARKRPGAGEQLKGTARKLGGQKRWMGKREERFLPCGERSTVQTLKKACSVRGFACSSFPLKRHLRLQKEAFNAP